MSRGRRSPPSLALPVSLQRFDEAEPRISTAQAAGSAHPLDADGLAVDLELDGVSGTNPETVTHRLGYHHLALGPNSGSHTGEYNRLLRRGAHRRRRSPLVRECSNET